MLNRVFTVGLLAGLVAGLAIAVLQQFTTTPIILKAEVYEKAAEHHAALALPTPSVAGWTASGAPVILAHSHGPEAGAAAPKAEADEGWQPRDGLKRTLFTSLATVLTAIGYALVLIAGMLVAGDRITPRTGLAWAAGAFAATGLATGLGLAPELPGAAAADLTARQLWWVGTAASTALALWLLVRVDRMPAKSFGLLFLVAPHLIGAPHPATLTSTVPAELAAHFASTSLALHAALWLSVGALVGLFWTRTEKTAAAVKVAAR
ncbi:CbtA family protein [Methyloraptor flagellatus]|uniref:CbtA family protein n=1 Tax=Methyloraptor flagellatus TaxID=3162530 RepID=A0AAU7XA29_9HYPH